MRARTFALALCLFLALVGCDDNPAQPSCTYTVSATSMTVGPAGGSWSLGVSTGNTCSWAASSGVSWIALTGGASGTGPGATTITVAALSSTSSRTGVLTVANQAVTVTQLGVSCGYGVTPMSRTIDAAGGTATFEVWTNAACSWSVASTAAWITVVSGGSGAGNGTVTYRVAANPDNTQRTGSLTVGEQAHVVTQTGLTSCSVDVSRSGDTFTVAGGSGTFDVTAPSTCAWAAVSSALWVRITDPSGGAGTGSRRVTYAVDANPLTSGRTATIAVGSRVVTVTQAGTGSCEYSVAPVEVKACMAEGFQRTISVTTAAGCPWTSSTPASWIGITSGTSATGPGSITYALESNYDAARQANLDVRWPTPTAGQNVRVLQAGCLYGVSRDTIDVPVAGGDYFFDVVSQSTDVNCGGALQNGCMWSAVPDASWVTVLSTMPKYGDDRVSFRAAANATGAARTATIVVRDRTVTVRQAG